MPPSTPPAPDQPRASIWIREAAAAAAAAAESDAGSDRPRAGGRARPLTRERVVAAAVQIADREGLDAVSIRRVAAALQTRPMGLYSHFETKQDLLELMYDAVAGEILLDAVPDDWREALREIARATRAAALRHPWMTASFGQGLRVGPAALAHLDQSVQAVSSMAADEPTRIALMRAVDEFALGHVIAELAGGAHRRAGDGAQDERRAATVRYLRDRMQDGKLPHLAGIGLDELAGGPDAEALFERGLDWLLAGAEASLR